MASILGKQKANGSGIILVATLGQAFVIDEVPSSLGSLSSIQSVVGKLAHIVPGTHAGMICGFQFDAVLPPITRNHIWLKSTVGMTRRKYDVVESFDREKSIFNCY